MNTALSIETIQNRYKKHNLISLEDYKGPHTKIEFQCHCGNKFKTRPHSIFTGYTRSCGCYRKKLSKIKNIIDCKFGKLLVKKFIGRENKKTIWECICDCGNKINVSLSALESGNTRSCGCLYKDLYIKMRKNISGFKQPNGKLTVIHFDCFKRNKYFWKCLCKCGKYTSLPTSVIISEQIKSCGNCGFYINGKKTSFIAIKLHNLLINNGYRTNIRLHNYITKSKINIDIALIVNNFKVAIEYYGKHWHKSKNQQQNDKKRIKKLINNGWKILIIKSHHKLPSIKRINKSIDKLYITNCQTITMKDWYK